MSATPELTVYPKGVLLETLRRRIIALKDDGYNDDFLRAIREAHKELERKEAQLAEYDNIIIPSWKREEILWRQDEADAIEFRRVLAEELDKRDATIAQLRAWLRDYQPSAPAQEEESHG